MNYLNPNVASVGDGTAGVRLLTATPLLHLLGRSPNKPLPLPYQTSVNLGFRRLPPALIRSTLPRQLKRLLMEGLPVRTLLALLIFGLSASANATLIQYDIQGSSFSSSVRKVSLLLDTAGASLETTRLTDGEDNTPFACFFSVGVNNLSGQILSATVDGAPVLGGLVGIPGTASIGGQSRSTTCEDGLNPFAGALMIRAAAYELDFFFFSGFVLPPPDELLAMADPVTTVLLGQHGAFQSNLDVRAATGNFGFFVDTLSVREVADVPEPSTLILLFLGLTGLAVGRKVQRRSATVA